MSVWKGEVGGGTPSPSSRELCGVTGTQAIITGKVSIVMGGWWEGWGGRKPGTRCSLGSRRNTVRTSRTLYCFLCRGIEAGARDRRTVTYLFALLNISPRKSEQIIEMKSRKGIKEQSILIWPQTHNRKHNSCCHWLSHLTSTFLFSLLCPPM